MNNRRMQFAVGVVALGSVFIGAILMMINSPIRSGLGVFGKGRYQLTIQLENAPGVGEETPVRKNGVLIGRVASLDPKDEWVDVVVNIDEGRTLTSHYKPRVRTTVLGDATIDFELDSDLKPQPRRDLAPGERIVGEVIKNPVEAISQLTELQDDIENAMKALEKAGSSVDRLATRVETAFGTQSAEGRVKTFMDRTEGAMVQFGQAMASINEILGEGPPIGGQPGQFLPQAPGQPPIQQPPGGGQPTEGQLFRQRLRNGLAELPDAVREFRIVLRSADQNLQNLKGFTEPLGRNGPQIAQSIVDAVKGLDTLVDEFTRLANALNRKDGTIGQLIHNPYLYQNLNSLTVNANNTVLTVNELALRLRPVVEDARVFMDKIAREPGRFISGAVGQPSPIKR